MTLETLIRKMNIQNAGLRIIFLHHSTGRNLINQGRVREVFAELNQNNGRHHEFWDHDYNRIGLTDAEGNPAGLSFDIPGDNTDPDGLEMLFSLPVHEQPDNALAKLLLFDVIAFKSCFPVSAIRSEAQLERYKEHYRTIRGVMTKYPEKLFLCLTPPPLIPLRIPVMFRRWTNKDDALRARAFSRWLTSDDFLQGAHNIKTFDLFDYLAEDSSDRRGANTLRREYRRVLPLDSHPNAQANREVGREFAEYVWQATDQFWATAVDFSHASKNATTNSRRL